MTLCLAGDIPTFRTRTHAQIVELGANASGGVTARLEGSEHQLAAAVVHVVLSRFEPHFGYVGVRALLWEDVAR